MPRNETIGCREEEEGDEGEDEEEQSRTIESSGESKASLSVRRDAERSWGLWETGESRAPRSWNRRKERAISIVLKRGPQSLRRHLQHIRRRERNNGTDRPW
jgi:hypothetical protein